MLHFPSPPLTVGQRFPDPPLEDIPTWQWDGEKWAPAPGGVGGGGGAPSPSGDSWVMNIPLVLAADPQEPLDAATKQYVDHEVEEAAGAGGPVPIAFVIPGKPPANQDYPVPINMPLSITVGRNESRAFVGVVSATGTAIQIYKVVEGTWAETEIGSIAFKAGNRFPEFNGFGTFEFDLGDILLLRTPPSQDATLADIGITLFAERV